MAAKPVEPTARALVAIICNVAPDDVVEYQTSQSVPWDGSTCIEVWTRSARGKPKHHKFVAYRQQA